MITYIAVEELYPHKDNPRKDLGDLGELADSIRANGILQNLTVVPGHCIADEEFPVLSDEYRRYPSERLRQIINEGESPNGYTVIIGHRRLAAAKLAGLKEVPCVVTRMTEKEQLSTMLTENMQRSDLTVYEQAQGFQMMIDLGETVESISDRSGFSKTTVRKRLKMAELDQSLLKEVSQRQVSLLEFDRLAQIEDLNVRNQCLKDIGTDNFKFTVEREIRRQVINKQLPEIKKLMRKNHVKSIKQYEAWGGKYVQEAVFDLTAGDNITLPKTDAPLFYSVDESYGNLRLYTERPKTKPVKRSQEEIDEEKRIAAAWDLKKEISAIMHKLRADFVQGLSVTAKNKDMILRGAVIANVIHQCHLVKRLIGGM